MPCLLYKALIEEHPLLPPFMMAVVMEMMAGQSAMIMGGAECQGRVRPLSLQMAASSLQTNKGLC